MLLPPDPGAGPGPPRRPVPAGHPDRPDRRARLRGLSRLSRAQRAFADLAAMSGVPLNVAIPARRVRRRHGRRDGDRELLQRPRYDLPAAGRFFQAWTAPGRQSVRGAELRLLAAALGPTRTSWGESSGSTAPSSRSPAWRRGGSAASLFGFWLEMWCRSGCTVIEPGSTDYLHEAAATCSSSAGCARARIGRTTAPPSCSPGSSPAPTRRRTPI